uniref:ubiquitinyl hydrolase 1 n=1 Tax=Anopheles christyi TaxID=43041 RepID=A0A182KDG6_9DIPT
QYQNREYFAQFVTEDIADYVERKRTNHVHGNHIEIQAMSEMYNRSVELYCYQTEPTNIFNSDQINNGNEPFRLSYQRSSHYNAIVNPYKASVGVGLGLAGYRPDELDIKQVADAVRMSEELEIEKTMLEDKLKTTDWEATNEEIEEQIARESYAQYCRETRLGGGSSQNKSTSSTITSTEMMAACASGSQSASSYLLELRKSPSSASHGNQQPLSSGLASDRGACSSSSKNSSFELDCCSSSPSSSQQHYYYESNTNANVAGNGTGSNNTTCNGECNRRKKRNLNSPIEKTNNAETKKCKANSNRASSTSSNSPPCRSESPAEDKSPAPSPPSTSSTIATARDSSEEESSGSSGGGGGGGASSLFPLTPQPPQATRDETPMSEFYQSLLESSYTDDGSFGQLSEREMIQKALEESALDFVKRCDNSKAFQEDKYGTTDEEYDSPSP